MMYLCCCAVVFLSNSTFTLTLTHMHTQNIMHDKHIGCHFNNKHGTVAVNVVVVVAVFVVVKRNC